VLAYSNYQVAFTGLHDGYASAIGMILFAVVVVTTTVVLYLYRKVQAMY
jgi:ABC-type sugar transport system permease subunit